VRPLPIGPPERGQRGKGAHRVLAGRNHPTRVTGQSKCVPPKMKEYYSTGGIADSLLLERQTIQPKSLMDNDIHTIGPQPVLLCLVSLCQLPLLNDSRNSSVPIFASSWPKHTAGKNAEVRSPPSSFSTRWSLAKAALWP